MAGDFTGNVNIVSQYGNVKFNTKKGQEYYTSDISTRYGNIKIDDKKIENNVFYSGNNEQNILKIHADNGNIDIKFDKK